MFECFEGNYVCDMAADIALAIGGSIVASTMRHARAARGREEPRRRCGRKNSSPRMVRSSARRSASGARGLHDAERADGS